MGKKCLQVWNRSETKAFHFSFLPPSGMSCAKSSIEFLLNDNTEPVENATRRCTTAGCNSYVASKGLCIRHGGGKRCGVTGCPAGAKFYGLCWRHGGSKQCTVENCTKRSKSYGLCWAHGGVKQCAQPECTKRALQNGCCWAHGGGKRCYVTGCKRLAFARFNSRCAVHATTQSAQ
ncbi:hypothetical protein Ae201684P_005351 [Aphanomyces euteiches]|nr:hypothetical protein Ae201684P_005351 [Aphanomyces euteiches]